MSMFNIRCYLADAKRMCITFVCLLVLSCKLIVIYKIIGVYDTWEVLK